MVSFKKIEELINLSLSACEKWVRFDNDNIVRFVDPLDGHEISGHYGATHAAVAFIILGKSRGDIPLFEKGKDLITSVINSWDKSKTLPDFHSDFNNFALCVAYDYLKDVDYQLCEEIKIKVCSTLDSNHDTVNWLPMRWYVNKKRYEWTKDDEYQRIFQYCKLKIRQATNADGGIEDILPKGTSFNLQYDIATVSVLQFLRCRGENLDLSKELGFLINSVAPDGDINYQGRGTNQVFAWGMWIYLLASSKNETEVSKAIIFLQDKIPTMIENNNILLNSWDGEEKYLWWDYHYCSVYTAHFLFWLVLSIEDYQKNDIHKKDSEINDSGVDINRTSDYFISSFSGRGKYLSEAGPIISSLWMRKYGMITKGAFGPWQGSFGNRYSFGDVVLRNYLGLLKVSSNTDWSKYKIIHKLMPNIKSVDFISASPVMAELDVKGEASAITIAFSNTKRDNVVLNFPVLENIGKPSISLFVDGNPIMMQNNIKIRTQYGWCNIFQSKVSNAQKWVLKIE